MCEMYSCYLCKQHRRRFCDDLQVTEEGDSFPDGHEIFNVPDGTYGCTTCVLLSGVITQLRGLIFREPWRACGSSLETPEKLPWEVDQREDTDSEGDGYSRGERQAIRKEAERAERRRWNQMKHEQADPNDQELIVAFENLSTAEPKSRTRRRRRRRG